MTVKQERTLVWTRDAETGQPVTLTPRQLVLTASALLIAAQLAFRGWALYGSWFYLDDYRFLYEGDAGTWGPGYLVDPFDSQLMPIGRLLAKIVSISGPVDWTLAASLILALQLLASVACLWMLITLFGPRWAVVPLLGVYLSLALTAPALMWWAAALNQVPLQAVMFAAIATWTHYLRTHRTRWLVWTTVIVGIGLLSYVKTLLLLPVLAFIMLAYFTDGGLRNRLGHALRTFWPSLATLGTLAVGYLLYYVTQVPSIASSPSSSTGVDLARTMLGTSLPTGLLGGPWTWRNSNPPVALADPMPWTVALSWVAVAVVVVATILLRRRTGRAWVLLAAYAGAVYLLALTTRASIVGSEVGRELRYLTDVVPVAVVCLGLAMLPLRGAVQASSTRPRLTSVGRWPTRAMTVLVTIVCVGGITSTATYARIWHTDNPGERYVQEARAGLDGLGPVAVADATVPDEVLASFSFPWNTLRRLLPVIVDNATFPRTTEELLTIDRDGEPRRAQIDPATTSSPGPRPDCGWRVDRGRSTEIPLDDEVADFSWWIRIGYIGSLDARAEVTTGTTTTQVEVLRGLHSLFLRVEAGMDHVTISGLPTDVAMCVDVVEVGQVVPGGPL